MNYTYDASVTPGLRLRPDLHACPSCAGVDFKTLEQFQSKLADLCFRCQFEYKKYLQFKYELEDTMRELLRQRKARLHKKVAA